MAPLPVVARRDARTGRYRLYYVGTRNEPFPGETYPTAAAARKRWMETVRACKC